MHLLEVGALIDELLESARFMATRL